MSIIAFKLTGDYAHFSHPSTIYTSLTYPFPPKTTIMGFLGALIGKKEYYELSNIKYSIKINHQVSKKIFVFNGIKNALSSNMQIKEGCQNSREKKQFYRELLCNPSYTIFLNLKDLNNELSNKIEENIKNHTSFFTPYLGINFCIADFEWVELHECHENKNSECEVSSFVLQENFIFEQNRFDVKLTTARMACSCESGRIFKDFKDFIIDLNGCKLKSKNSGDIFTINGENISFV